MGFEINCWAWMRNHACLEAGQSMQGHPVDCDGGGCQTSIEAMDDLQGDSGAGLRFKGSSSA
jgi:hypothetical protein